MRADRLLPGVVAPVLYDAHGVAHLVKNVRLVLDYYKTFGYVENWQLVVVCKPYRRATVTLELHGRDIDQADLGDVSRGDLVTCLACVCGINIKEY